MDALVVNNITCRRCSLEKPPHKSNPHLCEECVRAENNRVSYIRQHNFNWMEVAKEAELELWERQPSETDHEYNVWIHYRDAYPGRRPSYKQVALEVTTSVDVVRKIAQRWSFPARLQAWAKYCDELTLGQRRREILEMNKAHVDMAATLRDKLKAAIDKIDPMMLSPKDINSLVKTATELERKARLDEAPGTGVQLVDSENPNLKKTDLKTSDLGEIVNILGKAGVLNNFGVRQTTTTTTEVVVQDDEDVHGVRR